MDGQARPLVRGERVALRRPGREDRDEFLTLRRASADFLQPWEPRPARGVDPHSDSAFAAYLEGSRGGRCERLLLCLREGGALLGGINFNEISRGPFQNAALGYWIGAPFAGKGYMSAGLGLALRYGFENLALHRLEANIRPENAASLALVRRAGFRREGFSRRYLQIDGAWRDHERWALLAEDWRQDEGFSDPSCGGSGSPGSRCDR
ncbi:MAG: GNAT family protein [Planctomycetota bacterium]|nr:GNAT family protein [Planctomycetota bacterium]MDP6762740.1 GNAT family protein [Planctomycetota bacterium]MDP6988534.1 GNAT family protein [Planctomycetota bacterium]